MIQVLKTKLIYNSYSTMSISSVQSYNLLTTDIASDTVVKNVYLKDSDALYYYYSNRATYSEKKSLQGIVNTLSKHNIV